jgi:hypothetical protein
MMKRCIDSGKIRSDYSILCMHLPRYIEDGNIRLRPLSVLDRHVIGGGLRNEFFSDSCGLINPILRSWLSVWWWLRQTYAVLYCIEADSVCIGFIGLYNLQTDRSSELTLVIFNGKNRRLGYGTKAFNLLAQNLDRYHIKLNVEIELDNAASLSFWKKLGFDEQGDFRKIKVMSLD